MFFLLLFLSLFLLIFLSYSSLSLSFYSCPPLFSVLCFSPFLPPFQAIYPFSLSSPSRIPSQLPSPLFPLSLSPLLLTFSPNLFFLRLSPFYLLFFHLLKSFLLFLPFFFSHFFALRFFSFPSFVIVVYFYKSIFLTSFLSFLYPPPPSSPLVYFPLL